jgi:hypothetical protein
VADAQRATAGGTAGTADRAKSTGDTVGELWDLLKTYARQQTVDPVKSLGRFVAYGLLGSLLIGLGITELTVAALRVLQVEADDVFDGNWSTIPYLIALVVVSGLTFLSLQRIKAKGDR